MSTENERNSRDLTNDAIIYRNPKVIILSLENCLISETKRITNYFANRGFSILKSSGYTLKIYGDASLFQILLRSIPYNIYLKKIRNKYFFEKIYN